VLRRAQVLASILSTSLMAGLGSRQLQTLLPPALQDAAAQVALSAASPNKLVDPPGPSFPHSQSGSPPTDAADALSRAALAAAAAAAALDGAAEGGGGGGGEGGAVFVAAVSGAHIGGPMVLARPGPLLLAVVLEHVLLIAVLLIHFCIPDEPEAVRAAAARLQLEARQKRVSSDGWGAAAAAPAPAAMRLRAMKGGLPPALPPAG
jgi:hypothetical protein